MLDRLTAKLNSHLTTHLLIPHAHLIDEASRQTAAFSDPLYLPVYYHIGSLLSARSVVEVGFGLGLSAACFVRGCPTVAKYLGFQDRLDGYSSRVGERNLRRHYSGELVTAAGTPPDLAARLDGLWDVAIISQELNGDLVSSYMDVLWKNLPEQGLIIVDYIDKKDSIKQAFCDFCKIKNRESNLYKTRYGLGIVKR